MPRPISIEEVDAGVLGNVIRKRQRQRPRGRLFIGSLAILLLALMVGVMQREPGRGEFTSLEGLPVQSFDLVRDSGGIRALVLGTFAGAAHNRLAFLTSKDLGTRFDAPRFIDTGSEEVISNRRNSIRLLVDEKKIIAVYAVRGAFPGSGPLRVAVSKDGGQTFRSGIVPVKEDPTENQSYPAIVRDDTGVIHLFWLDDREEAGSTVGLRTAKSLDDGLSWQDEETLDERTCTCCDLAVTGVMGKGPGILYRDDDPRDMQFRWIDDRGASLASQVSVGAFNWQFEGCPHTGGAVRFWSHLWEKQLAAVVWTGKQGQQGLHFFRSEDLGAHWLGDTLLDREGTEPDLDVSGSDLRVVAYRVGSGMDARIAVIESLDGGQTWRSSRLLGEAGHKAERPRVMADAEGFRVFWSEVSAASGKQFKSYHQSWSASP